MKTVFDKTSRDALITRINSLDENNSAQWGKMNVYQMAKHCALWEDMVSGKLKCKRSFLGRLFGKMALKGFLKEELLKRNVPTSPELKVTDNNGNVSAEKTKWIALIEENANFSKPYFVHPFFGEMTKEQVGYLAYKHIDHHLRQFSA
jgi:hypothetical protein